MEVRHSSETSEHYTPRYIVAAARSTLDVIHLDPASCIVANRTVRAANFFTREDNGLTRIWYGNVFLNPPGGWIDDQGRTVVKGKPNCGVTGACGLGAPHKHRGTTSSQKVWWQKLVSEWEQRSVDNAIFVCFSVELLQSTQVNPVGFLPLQFPICYPETRVAYTKEDGTVGTSPPHSSCIICVSDDDVIIERFAGFFSPIGHVVRPA